MERVDLEKTGAAFNTASLAIGGASGKDVKVFSETKKDLPKVSQQSVDGREFPVTRISILAGVIQVKKSGVRRKTPTK